MFTWRVLVRVILCLPAAGEEIEAVFEEQSGRTVLGSTLLTAVLLFH